MTAAPGLRRRVVVIFNPIAGRRGRPKLEAALRVLRRLGVEAVLRETSGPGDAEGFARAANAQLFDALAVAGGDGTINEAVNGLEDSRLPIAVFPVGSENVLARVMGLSRDPARFAEIAARGPARTISVGEATFEGRSAARRFVLMTGAGFDAEVVEALDLALKRKANKLAFARSILLRLRRYRPAEYGIAVEGEGGSAHYRAASAIAAKAHLYAGPYVLAPAARLSERSFQLVLFKRAGRWAALRYMAGLAGGFLHRLPDVEIATVTSARFTGPPGAPVQIDGDAWGRLPVTVRIAERPLRLIYPGP